MLAGLNIPVSEDLMIILSAVLAATVVPENTGLLFLFVFLGCYLSDWVCYWIGRKLGPKLWEIKWFAKTVDRKRLESIHNYYEKYGFWTLLVGRFIPFGVRNCLFLSAGAGKMHFGKFILSDGIACLISNTTLFSVAYFAGKNYKTLLQFVKTFNIFLFGFFLVSIIGGIWYKRKTSYTKDRPIE
jgi:membrane protein DedA with SNARE-associated domain